VRDPGYTLLIAVSVMLFIWPVTWAATRIIIADGRLVEPVEYDSTTVDWHVDRYLTVKYLLGECERERDTLRYANFLLGVDE
jgi:hypothetical protein